MKFLQDKIFKKGEGDAWFKRNRDSLVSGQRIHADPALELLATMHPARKARILEIGCSNGWRLEEIRRTYGFFCAGLDPSRKAITDGRSRYPRLTLREALASKIPFPAASFDIVILNFVLHWVARESLLTTVAEADRVLTARGQIIITDFLPARPVKVPYHHLPGKKVFTYCTDYSQIFLATGLYRLGTRILFDAQNPRRRVKIPLIRRAAAMLLIKQDLYEEIKLTP